MLLPRQQSKLASGAKDKEHACLRYPIPPTNLGFRLVVESPQSVVASAVWNVSKLLSRT